MFQASANCFPNGADACFPPQPEVVGVNAPSGESSIWLDREMIVEKGPRPQLLQDFPEHQKSRIRLQSQTAIRTLMGPALCPVEMVKSEPWLAFIVSNKFYIITFEHEALL